jgi:Fic family protein
MNKPSFSITEKITNLAAQIAEQIGKIQASGAYESNLRLRKINRLRSIQSSTAIEGNTLSLEQISDVINGKRIIGAPLEIKEVKNAYDTYERILEFNPFNVADFLSAHRLMTNGLVSEAGCFRSGGVGVFSSGKIVHLGAKYEFVPKLIKELFDWAKQSDVHPLIKSCVMHFEIEFIHPFTDGNGRMGRFWQTLVLSRWRKVFAWIPIETIVHKNQQKYYDALGNAEYTADSTEFIEFMLGVIVEAIDELPIITDKVTNKITDKLTRGELEFLENIIGFLQNSDTIDNYRAHILTGKSAESVKKYFAALVSAGVLEATGSNKGRKYKLSKEAGGNEP